MTNNIIQFPSKEKEQKQDQKEMKLEETFPELLVLPEEIREQLNNYDYHVRELSKRFDQTLIDYVSKLYEKDQQKWDISLPLEALLLTFIKIAGNLDKLLAPEQEQAHIKIRSHITDTLHKQMVEYIDNQHTQIYNQDIFMGIAYLLTTYVFQYRIKTLEKIHAERSTPHDANSHQNQEE